jgi:hypothetical protein
MELRDYQIEISDSACEKLKKLGIVYLSMQVRTGKTITSLETAKKYGAKSVLFVTKKKAISSIESDYAQGNYDFSLNVTNYESLHKVSGYYDLLILDEHHKSGAFPKPNIVTKYIRENYYDLPMIFLSGTPTPETYSQIYHQFWVSKKSPFAHSNFYQWAREFVDVKDRQLGYAVVKDYTEAKIEKIKAVIDSYFISYTQKEAGFESKIDEKFIYCDMSKTTYSLIKQLERDRVIEGKADVIFADTAVKLMQKLHQMYSGTVILESGNGIIIDQSKALKIKEYFSDKKLGIFYKFKQEYTLLKHVFGDTLTDSLDEFNATDKSIALQIASGREGISLKNADYIVFYNIDFSAVSYWQARDRMTTMDRKSNTVFWVFSKGGIEEKIYRAVMEKRDYTLSHFKRDFYVRK